MNEQQPTEKELEGAMASVMSPASSLRDLFMKDKKEGSYKIARHLEEKYSAKTIADSRGELFIYRDGAYILGEDFLRREVRVLLEEECTSHHRDEILKAVKDLTVVDREVFSVSPKYINLRNGIYDIEKTQLIPHAPEFLFLAQIPVSFSPDADCPTIKKYLSDVLGADDIVLMQEWFGFVLYREYFIKKAIILVGEGDTGKSTLINLLYAFLGKENVSGVSLQKISYDKFAAANLYTKHANLYDDLSTGDVNDNGAFKIATGGGIITGEKKFGNQFQFQNYAKLTFACNKIPDVKNADDDAYFNRWIVVQFNRVIEDSKKDPRLIHKMTTEEELSGLFNFALVGLRRLLSSGRFSYDKEAGEIKTEMLRSASTIARFASDCLEESPGAWVSKEDMYTAYTEYARRAGLSAESMKKLGGKLPLCTTYTSEFKPMDPTAKKQVTAWRNVRIKEGPAVDGSKGESADDGGVTKEDTVEEGHTDELRPDENAEFDEL